MVIKIIKTCLSMILVLEIILIIYGINSKKQKYFKIFKGLFFGFFASIFFFYFYFISDIYSYDTGEWVGFAALIESVLGCIINIIIGLIGFITQKIYKKKKTFKELSENGLTLKCFFIVSIVSFIIIFGQYAFRYYEKVEIEKQVYNEAILYLKEKYGNTDFEITDIDRHFAANGFIGTDQLDYYDLSAIYIPDNTNFSIELDVDDSRKILKDSSRDSLIFCYFKKHFHDSDFKKDVNNAIADLNDYLIKNDFNVNIPTINYYFYDVFYEDILPNNYGHLPLGNDMYNLITDYFIKHNLQLKIDENEISGNDVKSELIEYIVKISNCIIDYYGDLQDYKIKCDYSNGDGKYFHGDIYIDEEYIDIHQVGTINEKIKR